LEDKVSGRLATEDPTPPQSWGHGQWS